MLKFFKYQIGKDEVVLNISQISHIISDGKRESIITMVDGKRYSLPMASAMKLSEKIEESVYGRKAE